MFDYQKIICKDVHIKVSDQLYDLLMITLKKIYLHKCAHKGFRSAISSANDHTQEAKLVHFKV